MKGERKKKKEGGGEQKQQQQKQKNSPRFTFSTKILFFHIIPF